MNPMNREEEDKLRQQVNDTETAFCRFITSGGEADGHNEVYNALLGAFLKAQDDLAKVQFKRDIDTEWKRIEAVVDEELERIGSKDNQNDERCGNCNEIILNNPLAYFRKFGCNETAIWSRNLTLKCCGKTLCNDCSKEFQQRIETARNPPRCPSCKSSSLLNKKQTLKAIEKFAKQGVPGYVNAKPNQKIKSSLFNTF